MIVDKKACAIDWWREKPLVHVSKGTPAEQKFLITVFLFLSYAICVLNPDQTISIYFQRLMKVKRLGAFYVFQTWYTERRKELLRGREKALMGKYINRVKCQATTRHDIGQSYRWKFKVNLILPIADEGYFILGLMGILHYKKSTTYD